VVGRAGYHPRMGADLLIPLLIILVLVLLWRGPKTLPKLGEALGRGVKEAKTEATAAQAEIQARASGGTAPDEPDGDRPS
jgi:Sec-independent protein translocase protein TatA